MHATLQEKARTTRNYVLTRRNADESCISSVIKFAFFFWKALLAFVNTHAEGEQDRKKRSTRSPIS